MVFFDMGSICATIRSVSKDSLECEIQNEGTIYENSQVSFSAAAGVPETDTVWDASFSKDVKWCLENDVDYIIHSVYEGNQEIKDLKKVIAE